MSTERDKLREQIRKSLGMCSDKSCTSRCVREINSVMKLIDQYTKTIEKEAYKRGYIDCGVQQIISDENARKAVLTAIQEEIDNGKSN